MRGSKLEIKGEDDGWVSKGMLNEPSTVKEIQLHPFLTWGFWENLQESLPTALASCVECWCTGQSEKKQNSRLRGVLVVPSSSSGGSPAFKAQKEQVMDLITWERCWAFCKAGGRRKMTFTGHKQWMNLRGWQVVGINEHSSQVV